VRVHVDLARCEAHGICEQLAPEVFELDDDDRLHYDPEPGEELRAKVEQAVASCPVQAIRLVG
jgi:ferredoxin